MRGIGRGTGRLGHRSPGRRSAGAFGRVGRYPVFELPRRFFRPSVFLVKSRDGFFRRSLRLLRPAAYVLLLILGIYIVIFWH